MLTTYREILLRDLDRLRVEIETFTSDDGLWQALPGTTNPPGVLALHLCGNLRHFIGTVLGGDAYVRDRDAEFAANNVARDEVLAEIGKTRDLVEGTLARIEPSSLNDPFPIEKFMDGRTTEFALLHFLGHFNYHLGQINYARRASEHG